jgi:hypothetical protein
LPQATVNVENVCMVSDDSSRVGERSLSVVDATRPRPEAGAVPPCKLMHAMQRSRNRIDRESSIDLMVSPSGHKCLIAWRVLGRN